MVLSLIGPFSLLRFIGPLVTFAGVIAFIFMMFTGRIDLGKFASDISEMATDGSPESRTQGDFELEIVSKPAETILITNFNAGKIDATSRDLLAQAESIATLFVHFDLIAVQSLRLGHGDPFGDVLSLLNQERDGRYQMTTSRLVGPPGKMEQFAFIFDTDRIRIDTTRVYVVDDPQDRIRYEPFVAHFAAFQSSNPQRPPFTFTVLNCHLDSQDDPNLFLSEQRVLVDVIANVRQWEGSRFGEDDLIVVGNLDGSRTELIAFAAFPSMTTVAPFGSTMVNGTRDVDHIILDRMTTSEWTSQSGVIHYGRDFGFTDEMIQYLTDHRMVWAQFSAYEVPPVGGSTPVNSGSGQQALRQPTVAY